MVYASLIATMAFGIIFNVPKRVLFTGGIVGMFGWLLFIWLSKSYNYDAVFATLAAAFVVASISQILARYLKMPATIFSIAGIIPLVPGGLAYDAMKHFVTDDYALAMEYAIKTLFISGSIAFGLIFSGIISQTLKRKVQ